MPSLNLLCVIRTDKPLPLRWNLQYDSNEVVLQELTASIDMLIKLGIRRQSERETLLEEIARFDKPMNKLMPSVIKDYFQKRKNDQSKKTTLKYLQFLVDQQLQRQANSEGLVEQMYQWEGIDSIKRKMENNAQGNLVEDNKCI